MGQDIIGVRGFRVSGLDYIGLFWGLGFRVWII